jgi:glucose-1-phosphate thymidylyltransferase
VELRGDRISNVWEKPDNPPSNLALIGIYYISSQLELSMGIEHLIKHDIRTKNEYQLTDAFQVMIDKGHIFNAFEIDECLDCGIPETLLATNKTLLTRMKGNSVHDSAVITNSQINNCTILENCKIENSHLENVIVLRGGEVTNQKIKNTIVGFDEIFNLAQTEELEL